MMERKVSVAGLGLITLLLFLQCCNQCAMNDHLVIIEQRLNK